MAQRMTPDDRRVQILDAVVPVILEHGLEVTTRALASAADVAEGTLYRSFGDKESLLRAVFEREITEQFALPSSSESIDSLEAFIVTTVDMFGARFARVFELTLALGPLALKFNESGTDHFTVLHDELGAAFEPYESRLRVSRAAAAELLVTVSFSLASRWTGEPVRATRDEVLTMLVNGLVVNPGSPMF